MTTNDTGRRRLGLAAPWQKPTLDLADYVHPAAPKVPAVCRRSHLGDRRIRPMLGNGPDPTVKGIPGFQGAGDCQIAAMYRLLVAAHLNAGTAPPPVSGNDALRTYAKVTGYDPTKTDPQTGENPTDQGTDPAKAMDYWVANGIDVAADGKIHRIAGTVGCDPQNTDLVHRAIWEFGAGVIFGAAMPQTAEGQRTWDVTDPSLTGPAAPWSWGGHAFNGWSYDQLGYRVGSWDEEPLVTHAFSEAYFQNCIVVATEEALSVKGMSAAGFRLDALLNDLRALYGRS